MAYIKLIRLVVALILVITSATVGQISRAASVATTFTVTLTVTANCTISAQPLSFGNSAGILTAINATTTITATCTNTTPYSVGLDAGTVTGSAVSNRLLGSGTGTVVTIPFQLYQDPARSTVWGATGSTAVVSGTGNGSAQTLTVYGQVPVPTAQPAPGAYTTTITATIAY